MHLELAAEPSKNDVPPPGRRRAQSSSQQLAMAMELPFVLVSAILVGGALGYLLDRWWHTWPVMMIVLGGVGFFAGVRELLRRLPGSGDGNGNR